MATLHELGSATTAAALFGADGLAAMARQPRPGNVRELRNGFEATLVLGAPIAPSTTCRTPRE